jgi:hypothetical protein
MSRPAASAMFAMAGVTKLAQSKAKLLGSGSMAWVEDFAARQIKGIGTLDWRRLSGSLTACWLSRVRRYAAFRRLSRIRGRWERCGTPLRGHS